jgi:hypothetical protein
MNLDRFSLITPDPIRAERTRARCHEAIARRSATAQRARGRDAYARLHVRHILMAVVISACGLFASLYVSELIGVVAGIETSVETGVKADRIR